MLHVAGHGQIRRILRSFHSWSLYSSYSSLASTSFEVLPAQGVNWTSPSCASCRWLDDPPSPPLFSYLSIPRLWTFYFPSASQQTDILISQELSFFFPSCHPWFVFHLSVSGLPKYIFHTHPNVISRRQTSSIFKQLLDLFSIIHVEIIRNRIATKTNGQSSSYHSGE